MISTIFKTNEDLTKHVIMSFHENDMPINELVLQKVVYQIKMDLGKNHPIYNDLPYYWYCYGPFSETLRNSFNNVKKFLNLADNGYMIVDSHVDEFASPSISKYPEIDESINRLVFDDDYVYSSLTEDIYRQFAPLDMLHTFRYGIFAPTEQEEFSLDESEYVDSFWKCQPRLFSINYLNDFNSIFNEFTIQLDFLNDEGLIADKWSIIRNHVRNLWFTFAQGLRCYCHDSYYDADCKKWDIIFKKSLSQLEKDIHDFVDKSDNWIDFSKYGALTQEEKNFIAPLIDIYLGDD
ncbi:hypothetical protein [Methanobrevibacter sp.]